MQGDPVEQAKPAEKVENSNVNFVLVEPVKDAEGAKGTENATEGTKAGEGPKTENTNGSNKTGAEGHN